MLTSKQRAELRAQANMLETTLMVGKGGLSAQLISETEKLLDAKELIKGRVLETAMLSARECCDALCEATGADGIQVVGSKFVLYRKSAKLEQERQAKKKLASVKKINPVRAGVQARRKQAKELKAKKKEYYHDAAVKAAIEKRKQSL